MKGGNRHSQGRVTGSDALHASLSFSATLVRIPRSLSLSLSLSLSRFLSLVSVRSLFLFQSVTLSADLRSLSLGTHGPACAHGLPGRNTHARTLSFEHMLRHRLG